jgi:hypothetical protein
VARDPVAYAPEHAVEATLNRIQRWEFWLSMVCFGGVAVFGAIPGIVLAIIIAMVRVSLGRLAPAFGRSGSGRPRRWLS